MYSTKTKWNSGTIMKILLCISYLFEFFVTASQ